MKIIIAGGGTIGGNLARFLTGENHEVYLVEKDEEIARKADEKLDVKVFYGNAADPEILKEVGIGNADLVISATNSDETNLVVCALADVFGVRQRIARVRSVSLNKAIAGYGYEQFHVTEIINPEEVAAHAIVKAVEAPGAREVADFADGRILLRSFDIPKKSPLCGLKIQALREENFPWPFLIIAVLRHQEVMIPKGDTLLQPSDRIYALLPTQSLGEFLTFVDPDARKPKKIIIYGATNTGELVASSLVDKVPDIAIIEENLQKAESVAGRLGTVRVINGSAAEVDILKESGVEAADAFIAASDNDNSNLISAVLAKKNGAKTTIIMTYQPDYATIVNALDINAIINPRFLAISQILRLVRGRGINSMVKLTECDAEALELVPEAGSPVTKTPIKNIRFPKEAIVGAIYRGSEVILANGDTQIQEGEGVIVFCQDRAVKKLQELFTHKKFL